MALRSNFFLRGYLLTTIILVSHVTHSAAEQSSITIVDKNPVCWHLESSDGFVVTTGNNRKRKNIDTAHLDLEVHAKHVMINNKKITASLIRITPTNNIMQHGAVTYSGEIIITWNNGKYSIEAHQNTKTESPQTTQPSNIAEKVSTHLIADKQHIPFTPHVKVLLHEACITPDLRITLNIAPSTESTARWMIQRTGKRPIYGTGTITITGDNAQRWYINGKYINESDIILVTNTGTIGYDNGWYRGSLQLKQIDNRLLLINTVDLESYVHSVLRTESWPGWPCEVNKAFAIASRSYVVAMMLRAHKTKKPYHVKNTNQHQTYTGIHQHDIIEQAIKETHGIILTHNNEPILAMFDSCCGGVIPAHIEDFNFTAAPYLARTYPCTHCKRSKLYNWSLEHDLSHFLDAIRKEHSALHAIRDIKITKRDKAGLVTKIAIHATSKNGKNQLFSVTGKKMYSLIKGIKSYAFNVQKKNNGFVINGKGYGHHLGLCQWGAREMVRDGWGYEQVLSFFYPGAQHVQLIKHS